MTITRTHCVVRRNTENEYRLISFNPTQEWELDSLGIWVWFLIDGEKSTEQITEQVHARYPETSKEKCQAHVERLISLGLASTKSLPESGVTPLAWQQKQTSAPAKPLLDLNVHFIHFPDHLDYRESYVVWLLSHLTETLTITDSADDAEIIFSFANEAPPLGRDDCLSILVSDNPTKTLASDYDYIISNRPAQTPLIPKWLAIPDAAFDLDVSLHTLLKKDPGPGYSIERMVKRLSIFLLGPPEKPEQLNQPDEAPLLTIGMATYDDYDGVYFSIVALQLYHPEVFHKAEIVILDNHPEGPAAKHLQALAGENRNIRYIAFDDLSSTAVRDVLFHTATADWVLCMDCHVMFTSNALDRLVGYIEANPNSKDLLQGPLLNNSGELHASQFDPKWSHGMYGVWGLDDRATDPDAPPFEIQMQGLGVFACRKETWPGFNKRFRGFGGEEGYIHQKIRNAGGRCLCLPFLRWSHRFARPHGARYTLDWSHRIRNYLIGFEEVGLDTRQVVDYFSDYIGSAETLETVNLVEREKHSPFSEFDQIVCLNLDHQTDKWEQMEKRFEQLGIADKVQRFPAVHTPEQHHIGCTLSHRNIIERAARFGYKSVLVFEDDAMMLSGAELFLSMGLKELKQKSWKVLYLGGAEQHYEPSLAEGCSNLVEVPEFRLTCTHAIAYHQSVYKQILDEVPDNELDMPAWLKKNYAIDQYLCRIDSRYLIFPKPFSQPGLVANEDPVYRAFYR